MLTYLKREISSKERRSVVRYMEQYRNIEAIIESKEMELLPSPTVTYEERPSQSTNAFYSEPENYTMKSVEIDEYRNVKKLLDLAYESVKPVQRQIWDECFIEGRRDTDIYYGVGITKRTYYREKDELIRVVAECIRLGTK